MDKANNRYVPKLLLSYVYVLDIRARLMRALESTTSCKRILLSRAPMCRKYFQMEIWFAFECFQRLILIFIFILTCICPICRHIILGAVHKLRLHEEGGRWSKKSTFCKLLYHRKCKRRGVGGQKKTKFVNVVCECPLMYFLSSPIWCVASKRTRF